MKLLYVEDNEDNVYMLKRRLSREAQMLIAMTGLEGVRMAVSEQPDVILMDLELPDIDGFETVRRIRAIAETCAIPIIALSAGDNDEDRIRALAVGCADYDTKPIDLSRLRAKIAAAIARRKPPD